MTDTNVGWNGTKKSAIVLRGLIQLYIACKAVFLVPKRQLPVVIRSSWLQLTSQNNRLHSLHRNLLFHVFDLVNFFGKEKQRSNMLYSRRKRHFWPANPSFLWFLISTSITTEHVWNRARKYTRQMHFFVIFLPDFMSTAQQCRMFCSGTIHPISACSLFYLLVLSFFLSILSIQFLLGKLQKRRSDKKIGNFFIFSLSPHPCFLFGSPQVSIVSPKVPIHLLVLPLCSTNLCILSCIFFVFWSNALRPEQNKAEPQHFLVHCLPFQIQRRLSAKLHSANLPIHTHTLPKTNFRWKRDMFPTHSLSWFVYSYYSFWCFGESLAEKNGRQRKKRKKTKRQTWFHF